MLERYRAVEQLELATFRQTEIDKHRQFEEKLQLDLTELTHQLADAKLDIHSLQQELGFSLSQVAALRASTSWKVTRPLRAIGLLQRGETALLHAKFLDWMKNNSKPFHSDGILNSILRWLERRLDPSGSFLIDSDSNQAALAAIVHERHKVTNVLPAIDPLCPEAPENWPIIDISVVTFNSERWIEEFLCSLLALDYPLSHINLFFVDNGSTDSTWKKLTEASTRLRAQGISVSFDQRSNRGFGAGHNVAVAMGTAEYCLVSNVDLIFEREALKRVVAIAVSDEQRVAAWELRQKPYEHPKFYDPVTGITNWNSHACVL
ncbi:Glycosyl transferase, family 2 domain protein, partial [mine drainage metagenome]